MNLADMIQNSLDDLEKEREFIEENRDWAVQYIPCGHSRILNLSESRLIYLAKKRVLDGKIDALILSSEECPICFVYDSINLDDWA